MEIIDDVYLDESQLTHKRKVQTSPYLLVDDSVCAYAILFPAALKKDYYIKTAVEELQKWFFEATGKTLKVISDAENIPTEKILSIGKTKAALACGVTDALKNANLGVQGYVVKTVGNSVYLLGNSTKGDLYAVYDFLSEQFGFDTFAKGVYSLKRTGGSVALLHFDVEESPDFESRTAGNLEFSHKNQNNEPDVNRMRLNPMDGLFNNDNNREKQNVFCHNIFYLVPPGDKNDEKANINLHPKWFSEHGTWFTDGVEKGWFPDAYGQFLKNGQFCLECHGDSAERELLISAIVKRMKELFLAQPDRDWMAFCPNDGGLWCQCEACKKDEGLYDAPDVAAFATMIRFVNELSSRIAEWNKEVCPERSLKIIIYRYAPIVTPPVKVDENKRPILDSVGRYQPYSEELMLNENVGIMFCHAIGETNADIYDNEDIVVAKKALRRLQAIMKAPTVLFWDYSACYNNYLAPIDVVESRANFYKFNRAFSGLSNFDLGAFDTPRATSFSTLAQYVSAKCNWNVLSDVDKLKADFFRVYFGVAADEMRAVYDKHKAFVQYLYKNKGYSAIPTYCESDKDIVRYLNDDVFPKEKVNEFLAGIQAAYDKIAPVQASQPSVYADLHDRIELESITWQYLDLLLNLNGYEEDILKAKQEVFFERCRALRITLYREGKELEKAFDK